MEMHWYRRPNWGSWETFMWPHKGSYDLLALLFVWNLSRAGQGSWGRPQIHLGQQTSMFWTPAEKRCCIPQGLISYVSCCQASWHRSISHQIISKTAEDRVFYREAKIFHFCTTGQAKMRLGSLWFGVMETQTLSANIESQSWVNACDNFFPSVSHGS